MVALVKEKLQANSIDQYKLEERSIVAKRFMSFEDRITELLNIAKEDTISLPEHVETLKNAIYKLTQDMEFKAGTQYGNRFGFSPSLCKTQLRKCKYASDY
jgi:hypothetical protein